MTPSEGHQLQRELIAWLTMLSNPQPHDLAVVNNQAQRVYEMSPPHALLALAAVTASRYELMQDDLRAQIGEQVVLQFPREEILRDAMPGPQMTSADMGACLDVVESLLAHEVDHDTVQQLLGLGAPAFLALAAIAISIGHMAVDLTPDFDTLADLIAHERIEAELGWLEREQRDDG